MSKLKDYTANKNEIEKLLDVLEEKYFQIESNLQEQSLFRDRINEFKMILNSNFTVAVVGVIKRGKSTFLNALMEVKEEVLSTDVTPETAKLSYLRYAEKPYAKVNFKDGTTITINLNDLHKYTNTCSNEFFSDKKGEKEKVEKTAYAEIFLNNRFLMNGVDLVDTPGVDDPDIQRSKVTEEFIAIADAVIFMIDAIEGGLKDSEMKFLESRIINARDHKGILCVCNKILGLRKRQEAELPTLIEETQKTIEKKFGTKISIYPIDALAAYEGHKEENYEMIEKSKFNNFTNELERFLVEDKGKILLIKRLKDILHALVIPIKEKLTFKIKINPENLQIFEKEILNYENEINKQSKFIDNLKHEINKEKQLLKNWVQNEIFEEFNRILFSETNADRIQCILPEIVIKIEKKSKTKILYSLEKYINCLEVQNIQIPNIQFNVHNLNITTKDFYVTKTIQEKKITYNNKISNAVKGAVAGSWLTWIIPIAPIITATVAFFSTETKAEIINKNIVVFDITTFKKEINNYKNQLIQVFEKEFELIYSAFLEEIIEWERRKKTILEFKKKSIESKKNTTLEQHINEQNILKNHIEIIDAIILKFELINKSVKGL